jgi:hypothetical protein
VDVFERLTRWKPGLRAHWQEESRGREQAESKFQEEAQGREHAQSKVGEEVRRREQAEPRQTQRKNCECWRLSKNTVNPCKLPHAH